MAANALAHFNPSRGPVVVPLWRLSEEMGRLFDETFRNFGGMALPLLTGSLASVPSVDVDETEQELCISAELPGVQASDLDVRLDGDMLTISGEKRNNRDSRDDNGMHMSERSYGRFSRSMQLPFTPTSEAEITAEFRDGVLTLHVPREVQARQTRRIEIRQGDDASSGQKTDEASDENASGSQSGRAKASSRRA